jgi:L-alanine-DL-glutamate epimerase-like enolase superfamily enzyme
MDAMAKVTAALDTPVCTGERRYTRYGFRDLLAAQAVDMIMPGVVRAGGIAETKKIAAMAVGGRPHVPAHRAGSAHQAGPGQRAGNERSREIHSEG